MKGHHRCLVGHQHHVEVHHHRLEVHHYRLEVQQHHQEGYQRCLEGHQRSWRTTTALSGGTPFLPEGATSAHGGPKTLVPEAQVSHEFLENYAIFQLKSQNIKHTINSYNLQYILDERSYDFKENDVWGN